MATGNVLAHYPDTLPTISVHCLQSNCVTHLSDHKNTHLLSVLKSGYARTDFGMSRFEY